MCNTKGAHSFYISHYFLQTFNVLVDRGGWTQMLMMVQVKEKSSEKKMYNFAIAGEYPDTIQIFWG